MREDADRKDLRALVDAVDGYAERRMRNPHLRRLLRRGRKGLVQRVNTPDRHPGVFIYDVVDGRVYTRSFAVLDGDDGQSFVCDMQSTGGTDLLMIHGHAVRRYVERHNYKGTLEDAQDAIMRYMWMGSASRDNTTGEMLFDYDGGCFLCTVNDGIFHLRTYIMHRQCFPKQRLGTLDSQKMSELMRERKDLFIKYTKSYENN